MTTARTTDVTVAVRFRWQPTGVGRLLPRALRPTAADYGALDVPAPLWPVYLLTRPLRLLAERTGRREPAPASLGPFLSTPAELLGPLLEFASLTSEDVLVDVGSGDGRLPIEAARSTGCRAKGIEHDPGLVSQAALAAETAGVTDKVTFVVGDAARADLSAATVVFIFLPANVTARLIEPIAASLQPGSRIIAHEQHALSGAPTPSVSLAIGAGQGMTVAHRWDI